MSEYLYNKTCHNNKTFDRHLTDMWQTLDRHLTDTWQTRDRHVQWVLYIVYIYFQLITEYNSSRCVRHIIENFDWYILPVANPDGYEYSRIRVSRTMSSCITLSLQLLKSNWCLLLMFFWHFTNLNMFTIWYLINVVQKFSYII